MRARTPCVLRAIYHASSLLQPPLPSPSFWPLSKHFGTEGWGGGLHKLPCNPLGGRTKPVAESHHRCPVPG